MQKVRPETQSVSPKLPQCSERITGCCDRGDMTVADGGENGGGEEHGLDEVPALGEGEVLIFNTDPCTQYGYFILRKTVC